ncbi:glycine betaine ABC transporter substrate-binding protein [Thiohalorhabdus sp.]|uniref:glycine betaine ABC transporter substrate-binding protein n=1 Tax=Thiohalorhabdus sp. TaxID=3094134 RepID=UPI002FC3A013
MGVWLKWLASVGVAVVAGGVLVYLINCGPALNGGERARSGPPGAAGPPAPERPAGGADTLRIGWTAWSDAEVMTLMAQRLLERHTDLEVERVMTDIGVQYQGVANGDLDIMLMGWLPVTHRNYWDQVRDEVVNLGVLYTGRLGWVAPSYVPEEQVSSLTDLADPEVAKRMGGKVQGIDPGSGLMQASEEAMEAYNLQELELVASSSAAMTAVLDRAIRNGEWVVVTAWQPHWIFASYDLRFLDDPKRVLGREERVHALAREGFQADFPPAVTGFFSRLHVPREELAAILLEVQQTSVGEAVDRYIETHPRRVRYWLTGAVEESDESPQPQ